MGDHDLRQQQLDTQAATIANRNADLSEQAHMIGALNERVAAQAATIAELRAVLDQVNTELGEAIHTGLRKAVDSEDANTAWHAIDRMRGEQWRAVLDFALEGLGVRRALRAEPIPKPTTEAVPSDLLAMMMHRIILTTPVPHAAVTEIIEEMERRQWSVVRPRMP